MIRFLFVTLFFVSCAVKNPKLLEPANQDFVVKLEKLINSSNLVKILKNSHTFDVIQAAKNNTESLEYELNQSLLLLFPRGQTNLKIKEVQPAFDSQTTFTWDLDIFGYLRNSYAGNYHSVEAVKNDYLNFDRSIKAQVSIAYLTIYYLNQYSETLSSGCASLKRLAEIASRKFETGIETKDQSLSANMEYLLCLDEVGKIKFEVLNNKKIFESLVGSRYFLDSSEQITLNGSAKISCDFKQSVVSRYDILAQWNRLKSLISYKNASLSEFLPSVNISGSFLKFSGSFAGLFPLNAPGAILFVLSQPILDIPSIFFRYKKFDKASEVEFNKLNQLIKEALAELVWAFQIVELAGWRRELLHNAVEAAEEMYDISLKRYEEGLSDLQTVLLQHQRMIRVKAQRILNDLVQAVAFVNILKASPAITIE